jgi:hypothetical protein
LTWDITNYFVVASAWKEKIQGSQAYILSQKWKVAKRKALKIWNHHHFGNIQDKIKAIILYWPQMIEIQQKPPAQKNIAHEDGLQEALHEQFRREEWLWKQK